MKDADWFWLSLATTGTTVELWALRTKRDHLTLSRSARRALHCHTKVGRVVTTAFIGAGSTWLCHHLLSVATDIIEA